MKSSQRPTEAKTARKLSGIIIAKRYLSLQRLRDEVRKAELSCSSQSTKPYQLNVFGRGPTYKRV
jgi:hypothetical protein